MKYRMNKKGEVVINRKGMEDRLHIACVSWFDIQYQKLTQLLFHIPNGGSRNVIEAVKFKKMGVRKGVADLFLSIPSGVYHGLYIELKYDDNDQSKEQKTFQKAVEDLGYKYLLVYTLEEFQSGVQNYLRDTAFFKNLWGVKLL
jgi:hypothetical protein